MKKILSEKDVRKAVIAWLSRRGYNRYLKEAQTDEHGVDIRVRHWRYPVYYLVEAKGDADPKRVKHPRSKRELSFISALGQITTRMNTKARYHYAIAFPHTYGFVLKRVPWLLAKKLNLKILFVNPEGKIKDYDWKVLKKEQT